jgi:uncharacterized coiled-coil DUF342 family protein
MTARKLVDLRKNGSSRPANGVKAMQRLREKCKNLSAAVQDLKRKRREDLRRLAEVQQERDAYYEAVISAAKSRVSPSTLKRWANEIDTGFTFAEVLRHLDSKL